MGALGSLSGTVFGTDDNTTVLSTPSGAVTHLTNGVIKYDGAVTHFGPTVVQPPPTPAQTAAAQASASPVEKAKKWWAGAPTTHKAAAVIGGYLLLKKLL